MQMVAWFCCSAFAKNGTMSVHNNSMSVQCCVCVFFLLQTKQFEIDTRSWPADNLSGFIGLYFHLREVSMTIYLPRI